MSAKKFIHLYDFIVLFTSYSIKEKTPYFGTRCYLALQIPKFYIFMLAMNQTVVKLPVDFDHNEFQNRTILTISFTKLWPSWVSSIWLRRHVSIWRRNFSIDSQRTDTKYLIKHVILGSSYDQPHFGLHLFRDITMISGVVCGLHDIIGPKGHCYSYLAALSVVRF